MSKKKNSFLFIFLLANLCSFSQANDKILFVPLKKENIELSSKSIKMLKNNSITIDSAKTFILYLSSQKLKASLRNYEFASLGDSSPYKSLIDSVELSLQWTSDQIRKIKSSKGFDKMAAVNEGGFENQYYGCTTNNSRLEKQISLIKEYDLKYIIYINKFEIKHFAFSSRAVFILHMYIFGVDSKKILGNKFSWPTSVYKNIAYGTFIYKLKMAFDEFYLLTSGVLENKK